MRLPKDYAAPRQEETAVEYIWERKGCVQQQREPIVRCRDCKWLYNHNLYLCMFPDDDGGNTCLVVRPDGFCAWGERKADA